MQQSGIRGSGARSLAGVSVRELAPGFAVAPPGLRLLRAPGFAALALRLQRRCLGVRGAAADVAGRPMLAYAAAPRTPVDAWG